MTPNVEVCGVPTTAPNELGALPARPAPPPGYVSLELILGDVERSMKDAENIDISVIFDEVCDSVMPVEQYAHVTR